MLLKTDNVQIWEYEEENENPYLMMAVRDREAIDERWVTSFLLHNDAKELYENLKTYFES